MNLVCNTFFQIPYILEEVPSIIPKSISEGGRSIEEGVDSKTERKNIDKKVFTINN